MRYWDTSALLPLLLKQRCSENIREIIKEDKAISTSWISKVELSSAICRLEREGHISEIELDSLLRRVDMLIQSCCIVHPSEKLSDRAMRALRSHSIKSLDAIQLASALIVSKDVTNNFEFITLDKQLGNIARKEGFIVRRG